MKVSVAEAKNKLTQLIQAVEDGESVTICRHGKPVVDLVRTTALDKEPPKFGTLKGKVHILDPNWDKAIETEEELEAWLEGRD
jgi:antitoxin (DNA-binding transcriptional repressor) of toxin-antitoxin stability system